MVGAAQGRGRWARRRPIGPHQAMHNGFRRLLCSKTFKDDISVLPETAETGGRAGRRLAPQRATRLTAATSQGAGGTTPAPELEG